MLTLQEHTIQIASEPVSAQVERMVDHMAALWWACPASLPELGEICPSGRQRQNEARVSGLMDGLTHGLKRLPTNPAEREGFRERVLDEGFACARDLFGFDDEQMAMIRASGIIEVSEQFARAARQYDPSIRGEDIYQASRNVMTMNFMQLLLGLPVEMTSSVFAYSMLYPYTDNYLDDPSISMETKAGFNRRFWQRLAGEAVSPANAGEERIWDLVAMVEGQYPRARWPQVYESLLAIHAAQARSLIQLRQNASPYEVDVLRISFEKGGASVLADGYLVAGTLSEEQAGFMFGYGAFTQLMDDLEDVEADRQAGFMTLFSQTAGHWPLDAITNRAFHLGASVFSQVDLFPVPQAAPLKAMIQKAIRPLLSVSAANAGRYYSRAYIHELEAHMPIRFGFLRAQNKKLERNKTNLMRLVM